MTNVSLYTYYADLLETLPDIPEHSIVSRSIHRDEHVDVTLFGFAPGEVLSEHTSARPALLHFLAGEADLTLGADAMTARAGTWVHMTPRLPHAIVARTAVYMLLVQVKTA